MRRFVVQAVRFSLGLTLLLILAVAGGYLYLLRSLPVTAGTFVVDGLIGRVEIVRDADAVPHIFAATKLDGLFGLGFVHAQDRLWQMEFQRRVGRGRLSEILGAATIREDRFLRTVGFGRAAESAWQHLPADARSQVDAYVRGVNAFIASHQGSRLPPEFSLLRFAPEPWTGPDVLVWVKMMAWDLSANYATELLRYDIAAAVGPDAMKELLPLYPLDGLNIVPSIQTHAGTRTSSAPAQARILSRPTSRSLLAALDASLPAQSQLRGLIVGGGGATEGIGSNNWVVDGTMTASGKPMLANDPHLGAQMPSLWYLAHINAGELDVIGATLPGTPAVAIGRNRFISWGETNMFADVQDLYRERLDSTGTQAEFQGVLEPLRRVQEIIRVKGGEDITLDVRISRHGPLVSDAINANNATGDVTLPPIEPLAFRWTALDEEDQTIVAFFGLSEARNWSEFTNALRDFVVPSQNFVYGDVEGHIGYYAPGRIPIRTGGDGLMPAEGWTGAQEWTGWIPFEELPHVYDPKSHFVVTANHRPVAPDYRYVLGYEYHEPYRAQRITSLLEGRTRLAPTDFAAIQSDTLSLHAKGLLPLLLDRVDVGDATRAQAVRLLRDWNFDASADSASAAIFEAWFLRLAPRIVGDELSPAITRNYERRFSFIARFVTSALRNGSQFCSRRPATAGAAVVSSCGQEVTDALDDALVMLGSRLGSGLSGWRWDAAHAAVFRHQAFDTVPVLGWLFRRSIGNRGDWSTVNVGAVDVSRPLEQREIPGYRQIVDLGSQGTGRFLSSVGQSGHLLSSHFDDDLPNWRQVKHQPMRMERTEIEKSATGRLHLIPVTSR